MVSTKRDMGYAGEVIKAWIEPRYSSPYGFAQATGFPASTTYAIIAARYAPDHKNVQRLEHALGWPQGTVVLLSQKDFHGLDATDAPKDLIRLAKTKLPYRSERRARNRGA